MLQHVSRIPTTKYAPIDNVTASMIADRRAFFQMPADSPATQAKENRDSVRIESVQLQKVPSGNVLGA